MIRRRRSRAGFTLMEVAVAAVLIAVLAAATIPTLSEFLDNRDAAATAETLSELGAGINEFKKDVLTTTSTSSNTYPGYISQLTNLITSSGTATTRLNSCGTVHTATAVTNWSANAPFTTFFVPIGGLNTPLGMVQDAMTRNPPSAGAGTLAIRMNVDSVD